MEEWMVEQCVHYLSLHLIQIYKFKVFVNAEENVDLKNYLLTNFYM